MTTEIDAAYTDATTRLRAAWPAMALWSDEHKRFGQGWVWRWLREWFEQGYRAGYERGREESKDG